jgi:hypothetical protein
VRSYRLGRKTGERCSISEIAFGTRCGTRSAYRVVGRRTRRRAAAMPDLDIIAASISLLISELRQRVPSVA